MAVNVESPNTTSENISFTIESGVKFQNLSFEFDNETDNTGMSSTHVEGECDYGSSVIQEGNEINKNRKVQIGKDQEKAQSAKDSHSKNPRWEKTKLTIRYLYHENIS